MTERQQKSEPDVMALLNGDEDLRALHARIAQCLRRAEVRERAYRFLQGLLANVPRKNGWQ
ncbi:MAG: hypothetical protein J2P36_30420 [Ktedonobacteraceae bacterium]|nr:hypothetical protein [Ktedonobacteraceae bacterium]